MVVRFKKRVRSKIWTDKQALYPPADIIIYSNKLHLYSTNNKGAGQEDKQSEVKQGEKS